MMVNHPYESSCRSNWAFSFHLSSIHPCKACSVGQNPINLPISAWSFIFCALTLILAAGNVKQGRLSEQGIQDLCALVGCLPLSNSGVVDVVSTGDLTSKLMGMSSEPILNELLGPMRISKLFVAERDWEGPSLSSPYPPPDRDAMMPIRARGMASRQKPLQKVQGRTVRR